MNSSVEAFLHLLLFVCDFFRLKKFDPDNDDESLSNLETQCDDKDDLQLLHSSAAPTGPVEYMECGMKDTEGLQTSAGSWGMNRLLSLQNNRMSTTSSSAASATVASWT